MLNLQRDILEEFAWFAPMALQALGSVLSSAASRGDISPGLHGDVIRGVRLALEPHGDRDRRLAWQRTYERWRWKSNPDHRERKNAHRRAMRKLNPGYGR